MPEEGLFSTIGRQVSSVAPNIARLGLALPAAFARGARAFFGRLINPATIAALITSAVSIVLFGAPILAAYTLYAAAPSNKEVSDTVLQLWNEISKWLTDKNSFELVWLSIGFVFSIAVIPWVLRFYIWIAFKALSFSLVWLVYIATGYDPLQFEEPPATEGPKTVPVQASISSDAQAGQSAPITDDQPAAVVAKLAIPPAADKTIESSEKPISSQGFAEIDEANSTTHILERHSSEIKTRFASLLTDLRSREETNLGIGMIFSIVGVVVLAGLVFYGTHAWGDDKTEFLLWFIPRLSIALFIQLFAYFFLGLYRGNLMDIKYFNNELTNMEYKRMATEIALREGIEDNPLLHEICLAFLKVERNFILRKGESAIEISDSKEDSDQFDLKQVIKTVKNVADTLEKRA